MSGGGASIPPPLTHGAAAPVQRGDHSIALRVMRLLRPELVVGKSMYLEEGDIGYDAIRQEEEATWGGGAEVLGSDLRLPSSIGQLHDGESFRICVSIHNVSPADVTNVSLKVELSTASKRIALLTPDAKTGMMPLFRSSGHRDFILDHPLQEEGHHVLMCNVTYTDDKEPRTFRKIFKFNVGRTVKIKDVKIWTISDFGMFSSLFFMAFNFTFSANPFLFVIFFALPTPLL